MSNTSVKNVYINSEYRTAGVSGDFIITKPASTFSAIPKKIKLLSAQIPMTWKNIVGENFIITTLNNTFQLIENCIVYNIIIPPATYVPSVLANTIQNALNAATPASNYQVTYTTGTKIFNISNTTPLDFELNFNVVNSMYQILGFNKALYPPGANIVTSNNLMQTNIIVTGSNNTFVLTTISPYNNYTITIPIASYTTTTFTNIVQTQLNAAYLGANYIVTFYSNENKLQYNIYSSNYFQLDFSVANSASSLLGFNNAIYPEPELNLTAENFIENPVEITSSDNKFTLIRLGVNYNIIVPPGIYTKLDLVNAIQAQIVAALIPVPSIKFILNMGGYFRFTSNAQFNINFNVTDSIASKIGFDLQIYPPYQNNFRGNSTFPFTFTVSNNQFSLFEDCVNNIISIPVGSYNYTTLVNQLQTLLNSVSSGFTVSHNANKLVFTKVSNFQLNFVIANTARILLGFGNNIYPNNANIFTSVTKSMSMDGNNTLLVNVGGPTLAVILDPGWYTTATLATNLKTKLDTVTSETFTVSYNSADFSYTITHTIPSTNFTLSFVTENSINRLLGFNYTSYSGAASYKSVNVATIQPEQSIFLRSNLVGGLDNGVIPWYPNNILASNNILAVIPINTTVGNTIYYNSLTNEPWQDMRESNFSKILLPGDSTQVTMQFSLQFLNGNVIELNGIDWSANLLLEF